MSEDLLGSELAAYYEYAFRKSKYTPRFMRSFFGKAGTAANLAGAINVVYGSVVYDQVNREANAHAIIKKTNWERSGARLNTYQPGVRLTGGADPGTVTILTGPTTTSLVEVSDVPGFVHTGYDMTVAAGFRAGHDDGLDLWAWLSSLFRDVHAQGLSRELLRSAIAESADIGANNTTDAKSDTNSTGAVGLETLDRQISSSGEQDASANSGQTGHFDVYGVGVDRDSSATYDAVVVRPDGSSVSASNTANLSWQIAGLDKLIDDTETNGADPTAQVWLTARDGRRALYDELGPQGRWDFQDVEAKLTYDGLSTTGTSNGRDITYAIRAYQDRPIVVDRFVPSNGTTLGDSLTPPGRDGGTGKGHWYLIDQRATEIRVGYPTILAEVDNPAIRGQFDTRAVLATAEQLYFTRWNTSGKMVRAT